MEVAKRALLQPALVCSLLLIASNVALGAGVNATFELLPAAGQSSTVHVGDKINLDLFLTLNSETAFSNVKGVSVYLYLPSGSHFVHMDSFIDDSGLDQPALINLTDNTPDPGDFGRGLWSNTALGGQGVAFPNGTAKKVGHFTVTALNEGTVTYAFGTARTGPRPTNVSFKSVSDTVTYLTPAVWSFTITPEPATGAGLLLGCAALLRHRRRR